MSVHELRVGRGRPVWLQGPWGDWGSDSAYRLGEHPRPLGEYQEPPKEAALPQSGSRVA